jgi:hypothetical protein
MQVAQPKLNHGTIEPCGGMQRQRADGQRRRLGKAEKIGYE